jgi:hypothetical protein
MCNESGRSTCEAGAGHSVRWTTDLRNICHPATDLDITAFVGHVAEKCIQHCRLACTDSADDGHHLAWLNGESGNGEFEAVPFMAPIPEGSMVHVDAKSGFIMHVRVSLLPLLPMPVSIKEEPFDAIEGGGRLCTGGAIIKWGYHQVGYHQVGYQPVTACTL